MPSPALHEPARPFPALATSHFAPVPADGAEVPPGLRMAIRGFRPRGVVRQGRLGE